MWNRLKYFVNPIDGRYEDLTKGSWGLLVFRDFTAGLIVAMVAIPLAMGFAMASGLKPEQGIVGGAVAGLIGALFGGSKFQVYGPTAAFIPIILGIVTYFGMDAATGQVDLTRGHAGLVLVSILAGVALMFMGLAGLGRFVSWVPHSIVVGFTIGIAITIALSQIGEVLGLNAEVKGSFFNKLQSIGTHLDQFNLYALVLALGTVIVIKYLLKVSIYIPAPLLAVAVATGFSLTVWSEAGLNLVKTRYPDIPGGLGGLLVFTPPLWPEFTGEVLFHVVYYAIAIIFVAAIESLLCSRMADRLADNRGQPFHPNKELWGQGLVNIFVPLVNGFPHTGALARTATNIKLGASTPLAGICKCVLKLLLAAFLMGFLKEVPMACIGGILLFVAMNMVKPEEVRQVFSHNSFHVCLMIYTALMVVFTDFLIGVLSAIILYFLLYKVLDRQSPHDLENKTLVAREQEPVQV